MDPSLILGSCRYFCFGVPGVSSLPCEAAQQDWCGSYPGAAQIIPVANSF